MTDENNKIFCKNFVNDVKDPEKFPHNGKQYKDMCNLFKTLDCEKLYVSNEDSALVNELCSHYSNQYEPHSDL
jgi:hypothetical protein